MGYDHRGRPTGTNRANRVNRMDFGFPYRVGREVVVEGFAETPTADYHGTVSNNMYDDDAGYYTSVSKNPSKSISRSDESDITPRPGRKYKTAERALQAGDMISTADARRESGRMGPRPKSTGKYK